MGEGFARHVGYGVHSRDVQRGLQLKGRSFSCLYRFFLNHTIDLLEVLGQMRFGYIVDDSLKKNPAMSEVPCF